MKLFSIRDSKGEVFYPPAVFRNTGDAIRSVQLQKQNPDSMISKFPEDFALFEIGNWDELKGICEPHKQIISIGTVSTL